MRDERCPPAEVHESREDMVPTRHDTTQPPVTRWAGDAVTRTVKLAKRPPSAEAVAEAWGPLALCRATTCSGGGVLFAPQSQATSAHAPSAAARLPVIPLSLEALRHCVHAVDPAISDDARAGPAS